MIFSVATAVHLTNSLSLRPKHNDQTHFMTHFKLTLWIAYLCLLCGSSQAQTKVEAAMADFVSPRMRVIIDNDFNGDPDGLFQLAHHLLSPSVEIRGIIGSHLKAGAGFGSEVQNSAKAACEKVNELLSTMGLSRKYRVVEGSPVGMDTMTVARDSEGARLIIEEAMRSDTKQPLYVVCGAGLTNIASAYLLQPEIAKRLTLIWIGGQEYEGIALPPPGYSVPEYNLNLCIPAAQTIFNLSDIPLWQVPRDAYRQCIYSMAEMLTEVQPQGATGTYLTQSITQLMARLKPFLPMGEVYILGDSPLVLLTALQSGFEPDPASSHYEVRQAPAIAADGTNRYQPNGRPIRIYSRLDVRLMFADMEAKLRMVASTTHIP